MRTLVTEIKVLEDHKESLQQLLAGLKVWVRTDTPLVLHLHFLFKFPPSFVLCTRATVHDIP